MSGSPHIVPTLIPYHRPSYTPEDGLALAAALTQGNGAGNGVIGKRLEQRLQRMLGVPHVLLTSSCTAAMELGWMALGLQAGDEVLLPSFTFVSCATSVIRAGGVPVFVDVDPLSLMIDVDDLARRVTPRTRAVLAVHYGGMPCDLDRLLEVCRTHGFRLVEDAAQAVGAALRDRPLGVWGDVGCFSFHGTKNISCGEGGAFITSDPAIAERAGVMREKGTNRRAFLDGRVDKYTWVDIGGSFELSDILAGLLERQFDRESEIREARGRVAARYLAGLAQPAAAGRLQLPVLPAGATPNWHIFHILLPSRAERDRVRRGLADAAIEATFHFIPLHSSPYARARFGYDAEDLPVTEDVCGRLLRLPIYPDLSLGEQARVIEVIERLLA